MWLGDLHIYLVAHAFLNSMIMSPFPVYDYKGKGRIDGRIVPSFLELSPACPDNSAAI